MDRATLLRIAADWSHWGAPPPPTVPRALDLPPELLPNVALVVQGVRRCGKSTLLEQLMVRYGLDRSKCLFINFEDPRLSQDLDHTMLDDLVGAFEAERGRGCTYLLDEVQWVEGWQRWLRSQLDRSRHRRFVVTGSNASLLAGEIGSSLTGRHHTVELFPFDLGEYRALKPSATLTEYLDAGGFPASVGSPDHGRILRGYFHDIVERDVRERVGARSSMPLRRLVQMLFESAGSETSLRRLAASLGLSVDTVSLYVDAVESAYLAIGCPYFAWSERKRIVRNRKYYPVDTGLRRSSVTTTGHDRGKQLECAVFLLLRRRFGRVSYWRGTGEVDFVVDHRGRPTPVQVSWEAVGEQARRAVDEFHAAHPTAGEAAFVTAESFEAGIPELPGPSDADR